MQAELRRRRGKPPLSYPGADLDALPR
jgi:hypothetical protein